MPVNGLLSTPIVVAAVAGGVVACVALGVMTLRRGGAATMNRALLPLAAIILAALAVTALLDRMTMTSQSAERSALLQRSAALTAGALVPGSALGCLDGGAGETVGNACEKALFADAQTAAAAVAFTAARLALLRDAYALTQQGDAGIADVFAPARRAIELDRYGVAAHVLSTGDGCTPERCPAFAWVNDTGVLKANMKVHAFETYVDRYAAGWGKPAMPAPEAPSPSASAPLGNPPPAAVAAAGEPGPTLGKPVDPKWDFPSSASIPPVSIMNPEPARPKGEHAQAAQPAASGEAAAQPVRMPPKRPQAPPAPLAPPLQLPQPQAAEPPAR